MKDEALEERVKQLTEQVQALTASLEHLSGQQEKAPQQPSVPGPVRAKVSESELDEPTEITEEFLSWAGKNSLLPRLSTLCFLLVVALALRTVTDNNIINTLAGSALGMGYAATLVAAGWYLYGKENPLAPVCAACGAVLMATIVVETHARFQSLPLVPAYLTLMATGAAMAITSYRFSAFVPISLGTLGLCLAGAAIDYPHPFYPYLTMVLLTANILGFFAARLKRCSWLRWIVLVTTILMLYQWGIKLGMALARKDIPEPSLAPAWFLPAIAVFAATWTALSLLGIRRNRSDKVSRFDLFLPSIAAVLLYGLASYQMSAGGGNKFLLGWTGIAGVAILFAVAIWLAGEKSPGTPGTNVFVFAGAALLAIALPGATGHFLLSLPALAVAAFFLALLSRNWENGGVRLTTYLMEIYACAALTILAQRAPTSVDFLTAIPAGLLTVICLFHYQWCRRWPPPAGSGFFTNFDTNDRSAVLLLLAALASGFFAVRCIVYQFLPSLSTDIASAFRCAQSIIITASAAGLILIAVHFRNKEIRNVAILVTLIGGIKVFLYDMLGTHGIPLVLSVLSFGLVAALESIMLGRWPRISAQEEEDTAGHGSAQHHA